MDLEGRIKEEHDEFRRTFERLSATTAEDADLRGEVFADLAKRMDAHEEAEERTVYEAMKDDRQLREIALEALEQHRIGRFLAVELRKVSAEDEFWTPKLRALKGLMERHMLMEEGLVLPTARDVLGREAVDALASEFDLREREVLWGKTAGPAVAQAGQRNV